MQKYSRSKFKYIFFNILILVLSINMCNVCLAEEKIASSSLIFTEGEKIDKEEIAISRNIDESWEGFYKNWIIDLAEVKMSFYTSGVEVKKVYVLPKQFEYVSVLQVQESMVEGIKDCILRGSKPDIINMSGKLFSNNIPLLIKFVEEAPYRKFEEWDGACYFNTWKTDSNNLVNLIADIGMSNDSIFNGNDVIGWLKSGGSIIMEPVTYYPYTNEEIHTNYKEAAIKYTMTNSASIYVDAIEAAYDKEISTQDRIDMRNGTYKGEDKGLLYFLSSRLYYHCGFLSNQEHINIKNGEYGDTNGATTIRNYFGIGNETENTKELTQKWKNIFNGTIATTKTNIKNNISNIVLDTTNNEDATKIAEYITDKVFKGVDTLFAPADIIKNCLIDIINGDLSALSDDTIGSAIENKIKVKLSGLISDAISGLGKTFDDGDIVFKSDAGTVIKKIVEDEIDWAARETAEKSQPHINNILNEWGFNNIAKGINVLDEIFNGRIEFKWDEEKGLYYTEDVVFGVSTHFSPLTYTETTKYSKEWVSQSSLDGINQTDSGWLSIFLGADINPSTIATDHNKYFITIPVSKNNIVLEIQKMLSAIGALLTNPDNNTYKYGAALITGIKATESEIKIEFHPNGGQLSDEAGNYNKNKIDDSYTKIIKSNEKIKIDKTYSDNFFRDVYSDEHKYIRYNTKADMSGKYYSVDSESSFTEDTVLLCCGGERSEPTQRIVRTAPTRCCPQTKYAHTLSDNKIR